MISILKQPRPAPRSPHCAPLPKCVRLTDFYKTSVTKNPHPAVLPRRYTACSTPTRTPLHSVQRPMLSREP
jgi:hypothetical protein